jgi:hypothetical protein
VGLAGENSLDSILLPQLDELDCKEPVSEHFEYDRVCFQSRTGVGMTGLGLWTAAAVAAAAVFERLICISQMCQGRSQRELTSVL